MDDKYLEKIRKKSNFRQFIYGIAERDKIYKKKEAGELFPGTKDVILQNYKFTNYNRNLDAVSKYIFNEIFSNTEDAGLIFYNAVIHRSFSKLKTSQSIKLIRSKQKLNKLIKLNEEGPVYTGAFMRCINLNGLIDSFKEVFDKRNEIVKLIKEKNSLKYAFYEIKKIKFVGNFIAGQIVADLMMTDILNNAEDLDEGVYLGPGAVDGLKLLGYENSLKEIKKLQIKSNKALKKHNIVLTLSDVEHSLCEYFKYHNCLMLGKRTKENFEFKKYIYNKK